MVCEKHQEMVARYEDQHRGEFADFAHNGLFAGSALHHVNTVASAETTHHPVSPLHHNKPDAAAAVNDVHHGNTAYEPSFNELHSSTGQTYHNPVKMVPVTNTHTVLNDHHPAPPVQPAPRPVFDMSHQAAANGAGPHLSGVSHPVPVFSGRPCGARDGINCQLERLQDANDIGTTRQIKLRNTTTALGGSNIIENQSHSHDGEDSDLDVGKMIKNIFGGSKRTKQQNGTSLAKSVNEIVTPPGDLLKAFTRDRTHLNSSIVDQFDSSGSLDYLDDQNEGGAKMPKLEGSMAVARHLGNTSLEDSLERQGVDQLQIASVKKLAPAEEMENSDHHQSPKLDNLLEFENTNSPYFVKDSVLQFRKIHDGDNEVQGDVNERQPKKGVDVIFQEKMHRKAKQKADKDKDKGKEYSGSSNGKSGKSEKASGGKSGFKGDKENKKEDEDNSSIDSKEDSNGKNLQDKMESRFDDEHKKGNKDYEEEDESGKEDKTQSVHVKLAKEESNSKDEDSKETGTSKEADTQQIEVNQNNIKEDNNQHKHMKGKNGAGEGEMKDQKNMESSDGDTSGKFTNTEEKNSENISDNGGKDSPQGFGNNKDNKNKDDDNFLNDEGLQDVKVSFDNNKNKADENMKFSNKTTQDLEVNQQGSSEQDLKNGEVSSSEDPKNPKLHDNDNGAGGNREDGSDKTQDVKVNLKDEDKYKNDKEGEHGKQDLKDSNKFRFDKMKEESHYVHVDEKLDGGSDKLDSNDKPDGNDKLDSNDKNVKNDNDGKNEKNQRLAQDSPKEDKESTNDDVTTSSHNKNGKGGDNDNKLSEAMINGGKEQPSKSVNLDKEPSSSSTSFSESDKESSNSNQQKQEDKEPTNSSASEGEKNAKQQNNKEPNSKQQNEDKTQKADSPNQENDKNDGEPKPSKEKHVSGVSLEDRLPAKIQKLVDSGKLDESDLPPQSKPSPITNTYNQNTNNGQLLTDKVQSDLLNSQLAPVSKKPSTLGQQQNINTGQQPDTETVKIKEGTDHEGNNFAHYTDHPSAAQDKTADQPISAVPPPQEQQSLQTSHHLNTPEVISPAEQNRLLPPEVIGPIGPADNSNIPVTEKIGQEIQQQHHQPLLIHLSDEHPEVTESSDPLTLGHVDNSLVALPGGNKVKESAGLGVESSFRFASFGSPVILHIGATGFGEGRTSYNSIFLFAKSL